MNPRNAFYLLELAPDAAPADVERQGRKVLAMLELGLAQGKAYTCPVGTFERDATMVREAMARLRDPKAKLREATLARVLEGKAQAGADEPDAPLPGAFLIGGYRGL